MSGATNKCLIFVTTKMAADMLSDFLHDDGWPVFALHGDKSQAERTRILNNFRSGRTLVMIATDVASRGLGALPVSALDQSRFTEMPNRCHGHHQRHQLRQPGLDRGLYPSVRLASPVAQYDSY